MWDKQKLDDAINENVIIFDSLSRGVKLTPRLFCLMSHFGATYKKPGRRIVKLLLTARVAGKEIDSSAKDRQHQEPWYNDYIYGIPYEIVGYDMLEYYKSQGGLLVFKTTHKNGSKRNHEELIVAELDDGSYLMGSC